MPMTTAEMASANASIARDDLRTLARIIELIAIDLAVEHPEVVRWLAEREALRARGIQL